jgi:hypothetical protein
LSFVEKRRDFEYREIHISIPIRAK